MSITPNGALYSSTGHCHPGPALPTPPGLPQLPAPLPPGHAHLSHLSARGPLLLSLRAWLHRATRGWALTATCRPVLPEVPRSGPTSASHVRQPGSCRRGPRPRALALPYAQELLLRGCGHVGPAGMPACLMKGRSPDSHGFPTTCGSSPSSWALHTD